MHLLHTEIHKKPLNHKFRKQKSVEMSRIDLPQKENNLFQKLMKCYEQKQFKNGLRHAKVRVLAFKIRK